MKPTELCSVPRDQVAGDGDAAGKSTVQWLVSVRNEQEMAIAAKFGVDFIDLKEPLAGALAPVAAELWQRAVGWIRKQSASCQASHGRPRLSAALGEGDQAVTLAAALPRQFAFAKAGPSGCTTGNAIRRLWRDVASHLEGTVELVAVAYADAAPACCVEPETVLLEAERAQLGRCLLDTFTKDGRSSLQHLGLRRLSELDQLAKRLGIWWALAGSITQRDVALLSDSGIRPDCWAVRGDVCDRDRTGTLCEQRMKAWSEMLVARRR